MSRSGVALWVVAGVALAALLMVGAALLLVWLERADAFIWLWVAIGIGVVAQVVLLARSPEGRAWLRRRWWLFAMQAAGIVMAVTALLVR